ncbi:MAG: helicase-associated domain-containing protein [Chloroflexota bacterium]|nr:helicase-associated domain-containing protein [Chloroflexota bacterium]
MSRLIVSPGVQPFYDEDDVRRSCGLTVFAQADALQRAGHVSGVQRTADALTGNVRGTWRRVDQVTIQTRGNRLQPECARHGAVFCRHAGALLLHWLREPASVQGAEPTFGQSFDLSDLDMDWDDEFPEPQDIAGEVTPEAELEQLLEHETIAVIREIARKRGVRVSGTRKADVLRDAAAGLAAPANVDAALAGLSQSELLLLDAAQLSSHVGDTTDTRAFDIYRKLGGEGAPPLDALRELGLVISPEATYYRGRYVRIPFSVVAQLPAREGLATPLQGKRIPAAPEPQRGLALLSLLTVVAQDALAGGGSSHELSLNPFTAYVPDGFIIHPSDEARYEQLTRSYSAKEGVRLVVPPPLPAADVARFALQTGQPDEVVEFAGRLLISLEVAIRTPRLTIDADRLRRLLELNAFQQLQLLASGWLSMPGWAESGQIFGDGGPIRWSWNPRHTAPSVTSAIAEGVSLVSRTVGRMPSGVWYDAPSFIETIEGLLTSGAPGLAGFRQIAQQLDWTWHGQPRPGQPLAIRTPEGWSMFIRSIVDAVLSGPMAWLGLVDVQQESRRITAFRVLPTAAILSGKQFEPDELAAPGQVSVDDDLAIVIPVGSTGTGALAPILQASELVRVAADGLHYQLAPNGFQALFEHGMTPDDIAGLLSEQTGGPIPKAARETLDRWWSGYGHIRLYDELTLIELGDDLLLRELRAATSLERVLLHQFSPRLIAVEDGAVEQLVTELGARGYAPRIVEGG